MSRVIKFRAWDNEKERFFEPIYEAYKGDLLDLSITFSGELMMRTLNEPAIHESRFKDRFILSQFTGLLDKNGVEIYEKDKINWRGYLFVVKFLNGEYYGYADPDNKTPGNLSCHEFCNSEVIGNIYQTNTEGK